MDMLVWTIGHGDLTARVAENGRVDGDAALVATLEAKLREPVTVYRDGTVQSRDGRGRDAIELRPGDGRYVVARVRRLCADGDDFAILGCEWR